MATINKNPVVSPTSGANLGFYHGTEANLKTLAQESVKDGAFYLTTDTHKIFVGNTDKSLTQINQIITVDVNDKLTAADNLAGYFAYVVNTNAFYYCKGSEANGGWVQLNAQADITNISTLTNAVTTASNKSTIKTTATLSNGSSANDSFSITGTNGLTVTSSGKDITISGANAGTQALETQTGDSNNQAKIHLSAVTGSGSDAVIKGGSNVTITGAADGITIASANNYLTEINVTNKTTNGFTIGGKRDGTTAITSGTLDPVITYGNTATDVHFNNGKAVLSVYTKGEIDNLIRDLNAVVYRGVLETTTLPTTNVQNGDLYLLGTTTTINGVQYPAGSMIIATGTETNGAIPSASITWQVIESAKDADTTYSTELATVTGGGGMKIKNVSSGANTGTVVVKTGDSGGGLTVSAAVDGSDSKQYNITVGHTGVILGEDTGTAVSQSAGNTATYTAITGAEIDAYGHLKKVTKTQLSVVDTKLTATGSSLGIDSVTDNNTAAVKMVVKDTAGTSVSKSFNIVSENPNLEFTKDGSDLKINLVWGTF